MVERKKRVKEREILEDIILPRSTREYIFGKESKGPRITQNLEFVDINQTIFGLMKEHQITRCKERVVGLLPEQMEKQINKRR